MWGAKFFEDPKGKSSATRVAFLLWVVVVLLVWAYTSVKAAELQGVPESVVVILGILMTGKVTQRFKE